MDKMAFASIIKHLSVALGLSLSVERTIEVIKHFIEPLLQKEILPLFVNPKISEKAVKEVEKSVRSLKTAMEESKNSKRSLSDGTIGGDGDWEDVSSLSLVLVKKATDPDNGKTLKAFLLQILGLIIGILFARIFDLQLFRVFMTPFTENLSASHDYLLTGFIIGGGSSHIHILIRLLTLRKDRIQSKDLAEEFQGKSEDKISIKDNPPQNTQITADDWWDIPYDGGFDRELLENVHRRTEDPNLVVYHHTAMHSSSSFEDIIRVIKNRNWVTGYHCVITKEGFIHPFCRWDRYGNHAKGNNLRSLGIAFNGNFDTSFAPGNNADGRFGIKEPTEVQLKAGARVVALWVHLYQDISLDFTKSIVPHKHLKNTACPGSNFPYSEFEGWIRFFYESWLKSEIVMSKIDAFRHKDYLFADKNKEIRKA